MNRLYVFIAVIVAIGLIRFIAAWWPREPCRRLPARELRLEFMKVSGIGYIPGSIKPQK
ncbi:MAG: hypothetical protein V1907_00550 [Candidatus Kerfeldbacteria bacterium]